MLVHAFLDGAAGITYLEHVLKLLVVRFAVGVDNRRRVRARWEEIAR